MTDVLRHYDDLLAAHYSWMVGMPFADKVEEQRKLLAQLGLDDGSKDLALDLGCGPGYQSAALCKLGYRAVIALDTCRALLEELGAHCDGLPVTPVLADLRGFRAAVGRTPFDTIVCMGDTLSHLETEADVSNLLAESRRALKPGGRLVLAFRDLTAELTGTDRFIPVRASDTRIMVCALHYERDHVVVTDLIHSRTQAGWEFHKSSYRKIRVAPSSVVGEAIANGFTIETVGLLDRMHTIVARRPISDVL